ncbi:MAG: molybdopterin dinucleotide binding domain-containing protein, partial [Desulfatibacillaceae bacterium]|nr:molybdopterin dinucleotide binding domain-containing protein [Desulfatibacillaceae bacterium]
VKKALAKLDFLAVIDPFLTRTARMATVVLPACLCFEKTQLNRASMRNNLVMLQDEAISPVGMSRPDWEIVFDLAKKLGLTEFFPWKSVEDAIDFQLAPSGIKVEALRKSQQGIAAQQVRFEKYRQDGFATPSGKVELFSQRLADGGQPGTPFEKGFGSQSVSFEQELGQNGLLGMSGDRTNYFTHSQFHNIDALAKRCPKAQANLHKEDAAERGINDGDLLKISTPRGEVKMIAQISDAVQKGWIQLGWGFGDADPEAGVNLLTDDNLRDPVTCTPSARSFYCKVEKIE